MTNQLQRSTQPISSLTVSEQKIVAAFNQPKIKDCSQTDIATMLVYCMVVCELPKERYPDDHEKLVLVEAIQEGYKHYSLDEFRIAFQNAARTGEIKRTTDTVWSFGPRLVGEVMKIYDLRRSQLKKKLVQIPKMKPLPTPQENYEALIGYAKEDKIPGGFNYASAYLHAEKIGVITLSIVDKQQYADKVRVDMTREMNAQEEAFAQLTQMQMDNPQMFRSECRTRLMKDHLKENYGI